MKYYHALVSFRLNGFLNIQKIHFSQVTKGTVPWRSIVTSRAMWAIIVAAFFSDWGLYVLLICVPLFLMAILHYEVAAVGKFQHALLPKFVNRRLQLFKLNWAIYMYALVILCSLMIRLFDHLNSSRLNAA